MKTNSLKIADSTSNKYFSVKGITVYDASSDNVKINAVLEDNVLSLINNSQTPYTLTKISVDIEYKFDCKDKIYVNGYQSWTDSKEYSVDQKMYSPAPLMQAILNSSIGKKSGISNAGDSVFWKFKRQTGKFYGISYGYVRRGQNVDIFGSFSERIGYTVVEFDADNNVITVSVDLEGKKVEGETCLLKIARISGEYNKAFDEYFMAMGIKPSQKKLLTGYTTWYNYYGNIEQNIVERDLNAISKLKSKIDIFQIDDGYQLAIGDWLNCVQNKFPQGMKNMAQKIHDKNMLAGLWLAPFAVTKNCFIYKEHPDWLIKDSNGNILKAGANWGGFYSLDIYNPEAREYIRKVFDTVLNDWGYDLVKLDFLYCVCMIPIHGKTRGEIMCEAMDFLRECCGKKLILGCGVPMMPAFGKVDYCRIGPDISLKWGKNRYDSREGVSTTHAILNSVFRRHLDGRAFGNDPDVFLLRNNNIHMSDEEKKTLAKVNKICGKVLFTSDNVDDYTEEKMQTIEYVFDRNIPKVIGAEFDNNILTIEYEENSEKKTLKVKAY